MRDIMFFVDYEKNRKLVDNVTREVFDFAILAPESALSNLMQPSYSADPPLKAWLLAILGDCSESGWRLMGSPSTDMFQLEYVPSGKVIQVIDFVLIVRNVVTESIEVFQPQPIWTLIGRGKLFSTKSY